MTLLGKGGGGGRVREGGGEERIEGGVLVSGRGREVAQLSSLSYFDFCKSREERRHFHQIEQKWCDVFE